METVNVRWDVINQSWQCAASSSEQWQFFDEWASGKADGSQFRFILSANNYVCRWLNMPGVQGRNLAKALPFALEESLIDDIDDYHLVNAGKKNKTCHRIYTASSEMLQRLAEAGELHHIQLRELVAETSLVPEYSLLKSGDSWLINVPGLAEAKLQESNLATYLDSLLTDNDFNAESLQIIDTQIDSAKLLKTQIESGFPEAFETIDIQARDAESVLSAGLNHKPVELLTGTFRASEIKEDKPAVWWKAVAAMAAVWLIFAFTDVAMENKQLVAQEKQVRAASNKLFKQLFPGERIRSMDRQINSKLKGGTTESSAGFLSLMQQSAKALQNPELKKDIKWQSFKFNDRQNLLMIDLVAGNIAQLQSYKGSLESEGLTVEISSATNDGGKVKGRLKVGASS